MSLSASTLSAIQKVGAAAFTADEKLKSAVQKYADRVNDAMMANPYGLGNNSLFETWKVLARLSQTMAGIEEELKKVYLVATELAADDQAGDVQVLSLAAPVTTNATSKGGKAEGSKKATDGKVAKGAVKRASPVTPAQSASPEQVAAVATDLTPTDVLVKLKKKISAPKASKATKRPAKAPRAVAAGTPKPLAGNALKLMNYLDGVLNANEFMALNQTAASKDTGIPMGSMTAALKKLAAVGRVVGGPSGDFKLVISQPALAG